MLFLLMLGAVANVQAGASPDEVQRLADDLTPIGAMRSGNDSGTIPEWTGGITEPPVPYEPGDHHPDPFVSEQPLFRINQDNLDQYRDSLGAGQIAMISRYPGYYLDVYPTHRTAAFPTRIYEMTAKNGATGALSEEGNAVTGVAEGFPFPFPETGQEMIWNHRLRYKGTGSIRHISLVAPTSGGAFTEVTMTVKTTTPYYRPGATLEGIDNQFLLFLQKTNAPARLAGTALLVHESLNQVEQPRTAWIYNPGQRRVIRAPNVAYDSPTAATDALHVADMTDMFNGALDRFDWELKGKREMYVPYNAYRIHSNEVDYRDLVKSGHLDPAYMRYELHRVWVVEASVKPDKRHSIARRLFYLDEDSWLIVAVDGYDTKGDLWRVSEHLPQVLYELPSCVSNGGIYYDLVAGRYVITPAFNEEEEADYLAGHTGEIGDDYGFTPDDLRRMGRR